MPLRRHVTRAAISGAAAAVCLALATPAWAASSIPLNDDHTNDFAADFQQECGDENFDNLPDGYDGWHFVLPTKQAGDFLSLTLTFKNGDDTVTVTVPDDTDDIPDFLSNNGEDGQVKHAYVFTPAGWQLVGGTAEITGEGDMFNLSHTCAGSDTPETPTPTTPVPTTPGDPGESENPTESGSPTPGGGGGGEDDGSLPLTGVAGTSIALTGLALIGGGVALTVLRRRRDNVTFTS